MFKLAAKGLFAAALAFSITAAAQTGGNEAQVKKSFEEKFSGYKVERVTKTPYGGLYEVMLDTHILYTDEKVSFVVEGSLVDTKTRRNVTQDRMEQSVFVAFKDLPLDLAIKQVKGDGSRKIALFEDPNCGYCKLFRKTLQEVDDVTVYTFVYPILSQDSVSKAKSIWCSADKGKAWDDWMLDGKTPTANGNCNPPLDKVAAFAKKHKINGTPTIFFSDNTRVGGAIGADSLKTKLNAVGKS